MDKPTFYRHLSRVQNADHEATIHVDIMTITGLMDDDAKRAHLARYAALVGDTAAFDFATSPAPRKGQS